MIEGLDKKTLERLYLKEGKSSYIIAEILGFSDSTIRSWCKQFGIPLRPPGSKRVDIDEQTLRRLYVEEGKSMPEIAKLYGCAVSTIYFKAKKIGL